MLILIAAISLSFQAVQAEGTAPEALVEAATENQSVEGGEEQTPPPPTDALTLIDQFDTRYASYGDIIAQLAARKARERYLRSLLIPIITRTDLDEGARGEIMTETQDTFEATEASNTAWAVGLLDPEIFIPLYDDQPRLALEVLNWAERDNSAEFQVLAVLEPVAMAGDYDASLYAARIDAQAMLENRPQIYGSEHVCEAGIWTAYTIYDPEQLDSRREVLDLPPIAEYRISIAEEPGESCEVSPSP